MPYPAGKPMPRLWRALLLRIRSGQWFKNTIGNWLINVYNVHQFLLDHVQGNLAWTFPRSFIRSAHSPFQNTVDLHESPVPGGCLSLASGPSLMVWVYSADVSQGSPSTSSASCESFCTLCFLLPRGWCPQREGDSPSSLAHVSRTRIAATSCFGSLPWVSLFPWPSGPISLKLHISPWFSYALFYILLCLSVQKLMVATGKYQE